MVPLGPAVPPPLPETWGLELGARGGVDLGAEQGPAGELYGWGVLQAPSDRVAASLRYLGDLRASSGPEGGALSDLHGLEARVGPRGGALAGALLLSGSATSDRWGEIGGAARVGTFGTPSPIVAELNLGAVHRQDAALHATGLFGRGRTDLRVGPRLRLSGGAELRVFGDAAPALVSLGMGMRWSPLPRLALRADAGLWTAAGDPERIWADQVAPGEVFTSGALGADLRLGGGWTLPVELCAHEDVVGAAHPTLALRVGLSRAFVPEPSPGGPRPVRLCVSAPQATQAELLGSFTDWRPIPLEPEPGGVWCRSVELDEGVHAYLYRLDGVLVTPADASMVREDEFGVRQGLLLVSR